MLSRVANSIYWLKNQAGTDYVTVGQKWLSDDVNVVLTTNQLNLAGNTIDSHLLGGAANLEIVPVRVANWVVLFRNSANGGRDGFMPYAYAQAYMNDAAWIDFAGATEGGPRP